MKSQIKLIGNACLLPDHIDSVAQLSYSVLLSSILVINVENCNIMVHDAFDNASVGGILFSTWLELEIFGPRQVNLCLRAFRHDKL